MQGNVIIVQGGQYGSEGKGQVAAILAKERGASIAVRTGSINAGHTVHWNRGSAAFPDWVAVKNQIVPTAWVVPDVALVLGAGTYIEPYVLQREIDEIRHLTGEDITRRLFIDWRCPVFGSAEGKRAKEANRHHAMGATGKGCSEAVISRLEDRGRPERWEQRKFRNNSLVEAYQLQITDTVRMLHAAYDRGETILLEGTQGSLLDLNLGEWPFVTNRPCNAAGWLSECGLAPGMNLQTVLVCRTYPIRVAGNSGPLPNELSWSELAKRWNASFEVRYGENLINTEAIEAFDKNLLAVLGHDYPEFVRDLGSRALFPGMWTSEERTKHRAAISEAPTAALILTEEQGFAADLEWLERTTVTKKIRRVGELDLHDLAYAAQINRPDEVVLTFLNYEFPEYWNKQPSREELFNNGVLNAYIRKIRDATYCPITAVTTGPLPHHQINL